MLPRRPIFHLPEVPGVYLIRCRPTGERYVGGSKNVRVRVSIHINQMAGGYHGIREMADAYKKHGPKAFAAELLEECAEADIWSRERTWLEKLRPEFNCNGGGKRQRLVVAPTSDPIIAYGRDVLTPVSESEFPCPLRHIVEIAALDM